MVATTVNVLNGHNVIVRMATLGEGSVDSDVEEVSYQYVALR
jgi:hypothetical protein